MATDHNPRVSAISPRRLWFGFLTGAVAWVSLGCIDIVINWRACMHQQAYGIPEAHPAARVLIGVIGVVLLIIAVTSGFVSYSNWRRLSLQPILSGEAVEHHEFLALLGVIVAVTLGVGILLLSMTPFFLDICWRAR